MSEKPPAHLNTYVFEHLDAKIHFFFYYKNNYIWCSNWERFYGIHFLDIPEDELRMQNDGNLVLWQGIYNHKPIWESKTNREYAQLEDDGNLVIYYKNNESLWSSSN